ncbi:hypothetical protein IGI04_031924 [Brassica rapa subsp. trilocularis]|uniref:Uncharacterized protein n=1 Tax=Brassica rapa subsp. trilocularis TaxID=1813537 RepID=A0ABQ7LUZ6_BRACM|nr:hypothetical protein IGI04_031924 [Brassica rapa subsp. trilocularis]
MKSEIYGKWDVSRSNLMRCLHLKFQWNMIICIATKNGFCSILNLAAFKLLWPSPYEVYWLKDL